MLLKIVAFWLESAIDGRGRALGGGRGRRGPPFTAPTFARRCLAPHAMCGAMGATLSAGPSSLLVASEVRRSRARDPYMQPAQEQKTTKLDKKSTKSTAHGTEHPDDVLDELLQLRREGYAVVLPSSSPSAFLGDGILCPRMVEGTHPPLSLHPRVAFLN